MKEVKFCVICSVSDPKRVYITIPKNKIKRATWFQHLGIVPTSRTKYICEKHFDLKNDILNAEFITDFHNTTRKFVKDGVLPRLPDDYPNNSIFANNNFPVASKKTPNKCVIQRIEAQCRACMKKAKLWKKISLCFDDNESLTICEALLECTSAPTSLDDELPQQICRKCEMELKNAYNFKKKVEKSDNIFRNNTIFIDVDGSKHAISDDLSMDITDSDTDKLLVATDLENDTIASTDSMDEDDEPLVYLKNTLINNQKPMEYNLNLGTEMLFTVDAICSNTSPQNAINNETLSVNILDEDQDILVEGRQNHIELENSMDDSQTLPSTSTVCDRVSQQPSLRRKRQRKRPMDENGLPIPKRSQDIKLIPRTEIASLEPLEGLEIPYENQNGPFTCIFCKKIFPRYRTMLNHERDKHRTPIEARQCKICDKIMESRSSFKDHMNRKHLNVKKVQCDKCGLYIYNNRDYRQHMKTHFHSKDNGCRICFKTFDSQDLLREHKEQTHYNFICTVCGNRYISQRNLKSHSLIHTGEKPFSCDLCEMKYSSLKNLKRHKEYTHECIKYPCFFCEQKFSRKQFLNKHVRLKHTTEDLTKMKFPHLYPHICDRCGKRFPEVQHLEIHDCSPSYLIHECNQCPARFPYHNHYRKHMATHGVLIPNPRIRPSTSRRKRQEAQIPIEQDNIC